jgi:hypothetical protein
MKILKLKIDAGLFTVVFTHFFIAEMGNFIYRVVSQ